MLMAYVYVATLVTQCGVDVSLHCKSLTHPIVHVVR